MAYHEEERTRLRRQSTKQAIALAMQGRWREAVVANKSFLESFPNDVDAYNRLGRAHMELGEYALAREAYEKAVEIDSYNTIAKKNLNRPSKPLLVPNNPSRNRTQPTQRRKKNKIQRHVR